MHSDQPKNFDQWLAAVQAHHATGEYDIDVARLLRITASLADYGVQLCSGEHVLPYVPWLRDGMTMNSRLVIHLPPSETDFSDLLTQQSQADIRVAGHTQHTGEFLDDISHHRMNLLVLELNDSNLECLPAWLGILADQAVVLLLGDDARLQTVRDEHSDRYFFAKLSHAETSADAVLMSPKGLQHTLSRRGGRSRRSRQG